MVLLVKTENFLLKIEKWNFLKQKYDLKIFVGKKPNFDKKKLNLVKF